MSVIRSTILALARPIYRLVRRPTRFRKEVETITAADHQLNLQNIILFTGSSTVGVWGDLDKDFKDHPVLNRGFGGSHMSDVIYYFDQLVLPYKPAKIFIYAGDNDLAAGNTPEEILRDATKLLTLIRTKLPKTTKVLFFAAKPSPERWWMKEKFRKYNDMLKRWVESNPDVQYIDVWQPMLDAKGNLRPELYYDSLHMSRQGYEIWQGIVRQYL